MSLARISFRGLCPRCREGSIFAGFLRLHEACPSCGLDLRDQDIGDGPAFFTGFLALVVVALVFVWLELVLLPPVWVHVVVAAVVGSAVSLPLLRPARAWFLAIQYRRGLLGSDSD